MTPLSSDERSSFRTRLARMPGPMHLLIFTRRANLRDVLARQLGRELRALSHNVRLELHDVDTDPLLAGRYGIHETPAIALFTGGVTIEDTGIRYYGVPTGTVLQALVDGIVAVSGRKQPTVTPAEWRVRRLPRPVHLDVFVPAACPAEPQVLLRLQRLTLLSPQISTTIVLAADFPAWARRCAGDETVTTVANDALVLREAASEEQLLDALVAAAAGEPDPLERERPTRLPATAGEAPVFTRR